MVEGAWSPTPGARKRGEGETELQNVTDMADICVNLLEGWGKKVWETTEFCKVK